MGAIIPAAAPAFGAFGSADMLASIAAPSLLGEAVLPAAAAALPGTIESAGVNFINGVPQNFGAQMSLLGDKIMPGEWDWINKFGVNDAMKLMQEPSKTAQEAPRIAQNSAPVRQHSPDSFKSFLDIQRQQQELADYKRQQWLKTLGRSA